MKMLRCIHNLDGFTLGRTYFLYRTLTDRWVEVKNDIGEIVRVDVFYFEKV